MQSPDATDAVSTDIARQTPATDPRVYLAVERTFLAWIRTGIALMGFGFILARFGIFLRQFQAFREESSTQTFGLSIWFGVALLLVGVLINVAAIGHHVRLVRNLRAGRSDFNQPSKLAIAVAVTLACVGLFMAVYLVVVEMRTASPSH